jgi:hypothetical protein
MQDQFNELSINDKRIFLLNNILEDAYFKDIHQIIKTNTSNVYSNYISIDKPDVNSTKVITNRIIRYLYQYEQAIKQCYIDQSRYKDLVQDVFDMKDHIEGCMSSKYINDIDSDGKSIFEIMIKKYEDTKDFIEYKYGGAVDGDDNDQSLSSALKILFNNPHLDKKFKKHKYYKDNYERINSLKDDNVRDFEYEK